MTDGGLRFIGLHIEVRTLLSNSLMQLLFVLRHFNHIPYRYTLAVFWV